jgi:AcrR family transcriptional regulator
MSEPSDPIQAQLIEARRKQILDAATRVFAARGFHSTTIRQIAKEAGVADGTIYNYFGNKGDLLLGILDRLNETEERDAQLSAGEGGDLRAFFLSYVRHRMALLERNLGVFRAILPELIVNEELRRRYFATIIEPTFAIAERHFGALQAQGAMKPLDPALAARAISSLFLGLLLLSVLEEEKVRAGWGDLPEVVTELLLRGLQQG